MATKKRKKIYEEVGRAAMRNEGSLFQDKE